MGKTIEEIRRLAAEGTTRPLPEKKPKKPKRERRRERHWRREMASRPPEEPRTEEIEQMDRHLDSILPNPTMADALGVHIAPFSRSRPGLDPYHQQKRREEYDDRNRLVRRLGFQSYAEYTRSPIWSRIRSRVLASCPSCELCGRRSRQVHHRRYTESVLRGKDDRQLVALCGGCHHRIEFRERDHEKLSPRQVRQKLNQLLTLKRKSG